VGYGNQGRAHALNLRDSGIDVVVGARSGGAAEARAQSDRFEVRSVADACASAELIALLTPDETHLGYLEQLRAMELPRLRAVVFAHGFVLRFQAPTLDPRWDVFVVAPAGPGDLLRRRFEEGSGIPAILAIAQDGSGQASARARAYAAALGSARAGVFAASVEQEVEVDLFGEQAVLCGGMNALVGTAFHTLVDAGYPSELAYLECVQQLRLTAELLERLGPTGMRRRISPTALFGDLSRGPRLIDATVADRMRHMLEEIRGGSFAREWIDFARRHPDWIHERLDESNDPTLEEAGRRVRRLFQSQSEGES